MDDRLPTCKPSRYVTSHPGQLSLAIPPWVGAMSTSESWGVNGHTARYTSPVSVVWQCKLVSGWGLRKRRSALPYGPSGSGRTLLYSHYYFVYCHFHFIALYCLSLYCIVTILLYCILYTPYCFFIVVKSVQLSCCRWVWSSNDDGWLTWLLWREVNVQRWRRRREVHASFNGRQVIPV